MFSFLLPNPEHVCSILASLLRNLRGQQRTRLLNKFTENDSEKVGACRTVSLEPGRREQRGTLPDAVRGVLGVCSALKYLLWHPGPVALGLKDLSSYFSPHFQTHSPGYSNTSGWYQLAL